MWRHVAHPMYLLYQTFHRAWIEQRYANEFDHIAKFCLFIGYPRSGHSLIGALLNAHPNVVVAHELNAPKFIHAGCTRNQLYSRIIARAYWFNMRGNASNYSYRVPNQWQGRFQSIHVIGDKRGGAVTRHLAAHPDFLDQVRRLVGIPVRFIHAARNPFDNISAISIWDKKPLHESIENYFFLCHTTGRLQTLCQTEELINVHHEDMIHDAKATLTSLCHFVGIQPEPSYVSACCRVVFPSPTFTRRKVSWSASQIRDVETRLRTYPFLNHYTFDEDTE